MIGTRQRIHQKITGLLAALVVMAATLDQPALANPEGGVVAAGSAVISTPDPKTLHVHQSSDKAIIDWRSFNIALDETTQIFQPWSSAWTLNRVVGSQDPSQILGTLRANGNIAIINPDGILFGPNSRVDVNGLIATTHDIRNDDFMAGRMNFTLPGKAGASIVNQGNISIADQGIGAFVAPGVRNQGVIAARFGKVSLAAANGFTLDFYGDDLVRLVVGDEIAHEVVDVATGRPVADLVKNEGRISADGGIVALSAATARRAVNSVVNNSGVIEARSIGQKNGRIILSAQTARTKTVGAPVQKVQVAGRLDASAPEGGDGGFIETSGEQVALDPGALITTAAPFGATGQWLIDPTDYHIAASGGDITPAALAAALANNHVTILTQAAGTENGDIFVDDALSWSAHKLTLSAWRNININASLNGSGTASLALEYGQGAVAASNTRDYFLNSGASIGLPAGQSFSTKLGSDGGTINFTVITTLGDEGSTTETDLQGMQAGLGGNHAQPGPGFFLPPPFPFTVTYYCPVMS
ncbi:MAG: filamentous hemagglutinin N-terminal domain-containing protein [Gammaproteobacteria bacterium]|nr:filamentous hemagglutinin N-terminal domain-containing protein [Gammaproteobacteria bacterium]MBU1655053.1 filamentous hemagglutinin N-terminal domain-containing protein [Gammaproteobacteria bacterium]MBU1961752.1 filamentous hemagglutinin N-terminal domain-containing protein [Gammaproteobacteria bacterium]